MKKLTVEALKDETNKKLNKYIPDDETIICRYLDLPKFMSFLHNESLYFTRADKFEDPLEGEVPAIFLKRRIEVYDFAYKLFDSSFDEKEFKEKVLRKYEEMKKITFVNCWTEFNSESYALWKIYSQKYGVAIQTTVKKLRELTKNQGVNIYKVQYEINDSFFPQFENGSIDKSDSYNFFVLKNSHYRYEQEIRAILHGMEGNSQELKIDVSKLVENIYISPFAEKWFENLIRDIVDRYGFKGIKVKPSDVKLDVNNTVLSHDSF